MSQYHPTRPDSKPFDIPFKRGGQDFLLREDVVGPIICIQFTEDRLSGMERPDKEQIVEILAATGND